MRASAKTFILPASPNAANVHLPFLRHVGSNTVLTRDGLVLQTIKLGGLLFETADTDELNYRLGLRDAMLRALGNSRFALYHHVIRTEAKVGLPDSFPDAFSSDLDRVWRERQSGKHLFVNDLYVTVVRRPAPGKSGIPGRFARFFSRRPDQKRSQLSADLRALDTAVEGICAALGPYSPRVLGAYEKADGVRSEVIEFLAKLYNANDAPAVIPHGPIGAYIPRRQVTFGKETVELSQAGHLQRRFFSMISIKDYPESTLPGMFDELYRLPFELVVTQSFGLVERREALSKIKLSLRRMRAGDDEALSQRDELAGAMDEVASGGAGFGEHHTTIAVQASNLEQLDSYSAEVIALLADLGVYAVREDLNLEPAWWAQFPGNFKYIARRALVSTSNFAGLASLHNFPTGQAHGNHWGDAVSLLETTAAGPYFFNFHQNDLGNFTVIGPSGSGKTVVLNFLLAQARRFNPRIIFFDKDRGAELFIRAIGGQYDRLHPDSRAGLNPLQIEDTPANRQFLTDWLALLVGGLSATETEMVRDALETNFAQPPERRRLCFLVELFRGAGRPHADDLYARMRPWHGRGERAWLFDNERDLTDLSAQTVGFDMTAILDDPTVRTPALLYFFHRVEQRLDGSPTIIVVDEGWKALDDDVFVRRIKDWEKTIRKRNGIVGFATQSAQDALESRIASAIIEQAATQIFMINPKARREDYIDGFGLSEHEFELVRTMPDNSHCFLIRHGNESVVARLDLTGEQDILTILSGRESTIRIFDRLLAEHGSDPDQWMAPLIEAAA